MPSAWMPCIGGGCSAPGKARAVPAYTDAFPLVGDVFHSGFDFLVYSGAWLELGAFHVKEKIFLGRAVF